MQYLKTEDKLLIYCLRAHFNSFSNQEEIVQTILKKEINWDYLISTASFNRVASLLWDTLNRLTPENIPKPVASKLQSICDKITYRNQHNIAELKKLLILFKENSIPIIPFKGAMLAIHYSDISLRQWFDIDVIIHKQDFSKSYNLLVLNGYKPRLQHNADQLNDFIVKYHSYPFTNEEGTTEIDIHWSLEDENENDGIHFPIQRIWEKHVKQTYFDIEVPTLSPDDLILSTCIHHGLRSNWSRFKYIFDFGIVLSSFKHLDWEEIIRSAEKLKIKNTLLAGAFLANRLLTTTIPFQLEEKISKSKSIKRIERIVYKRLFEECNENDIIISNIRIQFFTKDNLKSKFNFIKSLLLPSLKPNLRDKKFIRLPKYLYFLYYFIKPFRLLKKYKFLPDKKK